MIIYFIILLYDWLVLKGVTREKHTILPNIEIHTYYARQTQVTYKFVVKNKTIVLS